MAIQTSTFLDQQYGDTYRIRFEFHETKRATFFAKQQGHIRMFVEQRPDCPFPAGPVAHLLVDDEICVAVGRAPKDIEQAKAIALLWLRGYSIFCRSGKFPNDGGRVQVNDQTTTNPAQALPPTGP